MHVTSYTISISYVIITKQIINGLVENGYNYMKQSVAMGNKMADPLGNHGDNAETNSVEKAHISLVKYCDTYLRQKEAGLFSIKLI